MNLTPSEEQEAIIAALHDFSVNEIRPSAREAEAAGAPSERIAKQLVEMGVAVPIPEEFGGQGVFDAVTSVMIAEEIAWGDPATAFAVLSAGLGATLVEAAGTAEQRSELLPRVLEGQKLTVALAEREAGADFSVLSTYAAAGDEAQISGTKYAVVDAESARHLIVARGGDRPMVYLAPEGARAEITREDKLGLRGAPTFKVTYDSLNSCVPVGGVEVDPRVIELALLRAKLLNAGVALGLGRAALEYATTYAKERTAFGRPIGAFQAISFKIADRAMDLESAKLMVWKAAWSVDKQMDGAARDVFSACGHAVGAALAAADDGVQILGGHGYMQDHPEEMWYRDALTLATLDSPSLIGDVFLAQQYSQGGAR